MGVLNIFWSKLKLLYKIGTISITIGLFLVFIANSMKICTAGVISIIIGILAIIKGIKNTIGNILNE